MSQPGVPYRVNAACTASLKWLGPTLPVTGLRHGMFMLPGEMFWAWEVREGERLWQQEGVGRRRAQKCLHKAQQQSLFNSWLSPYLWRESWPVLLPASGRVFVSVLLKLQLTL